MNQNDFEKPIKHKLIFDKLCNDIIKGHYKPGDKLPTEHELARIFQTSRPTIGRAMRDLQQKGLIIRRQGQGTFVMQSAKPNNQTFGLLVHWQIRPVQTTSSTIFGVMVPELLKYASHFGYSLLLNDIPQGNHSDYTAQEQAICKLLVNSQVAGAFFTPLELKQNNMINQNIAEQLTKAKVAVVLLDRDITDSYHRSQYDIVGINNEQAALVLTHHLIELGCRKIDFVCGPVQTTAIIDRYRGYRAALEEHTISLENHRLHQFESRLLNENPDDPKGKELLERIRTGQTEALVCVNDSTAADIVYYCIRNGLKIPQDVRVVGFDDLPTDESLPVSLTTIRQNIAALAYEAVRTMVDRIENPDIPPRDIMVKADLIIRESCGSRLRSHRR